MAAKGKAPPVKPRRTIAALEAELEKRTAERDEALAQRIATAEVLGVINSSPGDLAPVFDAMLDKAMTLCGAVFGALMSYDGEKVSAVATRGLPPELADVFREPIAPRRVGDAPYARFLRGEPLLHIVDMAADEVRLSLASRPRALVEIGGARTGLEIPLRKAKGGALLGSIWLYRQEVRPFTEKQVALLQNFAVQAVIAMENARLITETREALEQQTATAEVLGVINASPGELAPVFDAILDKGLYLCEAAFGTLWTFDGECFHAVALRRVPAGFAEVLTRAPYRPEPGSGHESLLRGASYFQLDDAEAEVRIGPVRRALVELGGARTVIAVPLRKEGTILGAISAFRQEVRPFSDKQIALLQNFAAQAVIAMENARLITETREALEQQTATAEVLGVINSSPGDLTPVFDAILEKAHTLCGAEHGALMTYDGEFFRAVALHDMAEPLATWLREPFRSAAGDVRERLLQGERLIHIPDIAEFEQTSQERRAALDAGVRTLLLVPLRKHDDLLGYITAHRREVKPFSDKQIALLQNFAAQAVIAMENARLITETREALEQQTATAEVLQVINSSPGDLQPVFDATAERAVRLCNAANALIRTLDGDWYHLVAASGEPHVVEQAKQLGPLPAMGPMHGRITDGEDLVHIADVHDTDLYREHPGHRQRLDIWGIRSWLAVALRKDGAVVGTIIVTRREVRPFSEREIALLQSFAAQVVIAMENARLITETREALEQQTATAQVLQVINSSPGDLAPVFDAILEKAHSLCGVPFGSLQLYDGEHFRAVATHGVIEPLASLLRQPYTMSELDSPGGRLIAGERFYQIPDLMEAQSSSPNPRGKAAVELVGIRTLLFLPLRKESRLVGLITAGRQDVQPFLEKEISLLENFAAQAVIAIENARLITETREALEQQTATAEVLGVINSSPGDLAPVFDAMLEKATRLCNAPFGQLAIYDGELFRFVAAHGEKAFALNLQREPHPASDGVTWLRILGGEDVVHVPDVRDTDLYRSGHLRTREFVDNGRGRSLLSVALRKDETLLGVLSIYRQEPQPFTDKQILLLQNFAAQAVIAMENARLLGELRQRTEEIGELNRGLEARVAAQVEELGRVGRLKRFLAPQLAELIVSQGDEKILESHRREIVVVFCDVRGYTAFTETAEPEEVLDFLRQYHGALGPLVAQFEGTLDQFSGDGIMVFFNDPVPCPDPAERAVKMAMAMREAAGSLIAAWRRRDRELGFGVGIAQGYATLGQIGFAERSGYTAIGTVCNLAARLCAEAKDGQILISGRVAAAVEKAVPLEDLGSLALKGLSQPVSAFNVPLTASQPALRVIEGGPQSV